ncbi:unnamed protein product [Staurois parvus]|uniref:Rab11-FIP3/4 domain-containing protein n=1 Tax=Staurois parvus TaxID=386267 RepID=A0ABN9F4V4_9NEOB|nr:unnamed protein product [Staurois parvus]
MAYDDTDLTDKVLYLEQRVSELERDATTTSEQQNRLRQENLQLLHRAHALEEQLKDQELQSDEVQSEETRKHRDELRKMERDRSYRLTSLKARLQELENENLDLRSQLPGFKATAQRRNINCWIRWRTSRNSFKTSRIRTECWGESSVKSCTNSRQRKNGAKR